MSQTPDLPYSPSRRTVLAGAFGVGAVGGTGLTASAAADGLGEVTIPDAPGLFYLALSGITGDVTASGFEGQISLLTFGWGVTSSTDPLAGGGGSGAGKATPGDLIAVGYTSIHSPPVVGTLNAGRRLSTATLSCVKKINRSASTFMTIAFQNVFVTSYYVTPDISTGRPLDVFHLKYTAITQTFTPRDPTTGAPGTTVVTSWDYLRNVGS